MYQVMEQTYDEAFAMYMKLTKKELAQCLATRTVPEQDREPIFLGLNACPAANDVSGLNKLMDVTVSQNIEGVLSKYNFVLPDVACNIPMHTLPYNT